MNNWEKQTMIVTTVILSGSVLFGCLMGNWAYTKRHGKLHEAVSQRHVGRRC